MISINPDEILQTKGAVLLLAPSATLAYIFVIGGGWSYLVLSGIFLTPTVLHAIDEPEEGDDTVLSEFGQRVRDGFDAFWFVGVTTTLIISTPFLESADVIIVGLYMFNVFLMLIILFGFFGGSLLKEELK